MSVKIVEEKFVTPLTCSRCEYAWNYSGKNTYVATCPYCRTKLSISKNRREVPQTDRRRSLLLSNWSRTWWTVGVFFHTIFVIFFVLSNFNWSFFYLIFASF